MFWSQDSGSGKGEGIDVLLDLVKKYNTIISNPDDKLESGDFKGGAN